MRLLDQTGAGAGAALCQMVGMEGKRQLEGVELEGVRALFLPAWARPGATGAACGWLWQAEAWGACVWDAGEVGASRQDIRCPMPVETGGGPGPAWQALAGSSFNKKRLLAGLESREKL